MLTSVAECRIRANLRHFDVVEECVLPLIQRVQEACSKRPAIYRAFPRIYREIPGMKERSLMHCPSCGAEAIMGLKYCKRCGENISHTFQLPQHQYQNQGSKSGGTAGLALSAWALALATVVITLGGFGIVFSHAFDLMRPLRMGESAVANAEVVSMMMISFGSVVLFGIVAMLVRVFSKIMGLQSAQPEKASSQRPAVIDYPPQQLSSPPHSISSVTEHTTRNFELPQYREPKARE
jgi:hypothetical protein